MYFGEQTIADVGRRIASECHESHHLLPPNNASQKLIGEFTHAHSGCHLILLPFTLACLYVSTSPRTLTLTPFSTSGFQKHINEVDARKTTPQNRRKDERVNIPTSEGSDLAHIG